MLIHLILKRTLRDIQLLPPFNPTPFQTNLVQFCQSEEKETKDPPEMDSSLPKVTEQEKRVAIRFLVLPTRLMELHFTEMQKMGRESDFEKKY